MNNRLTRRTAANVRAALAIVAFTALAAVGFGTTKSLRPVARPAAETTRHLVAPASTTQPHLHHAPAACPMPAGAFRSR